jgi:histidinol-phosphate aminotransferase
MVAPDPRAGILDIEPYVGGEAKLPGFDRPIRLASNENPFGASQRAIEAYAHAAQELHRYPDGGHRRLREAIGQRYGLDCARIVCGAGSDELIGLIIRAYAGPGDEVLYSRHGFLMYPLTAMSVGATAVAAPERSLTTDIEELLKRVSSRTKVLFLANPNNPTGSYLPSAALKTLRERLPARIILAIDSAYAEYVVRNDYSAGVELVDAGDNVVMTRTFSKIHGLAGARLGWAYCPPSLAAVLNRVRGPFNLSQAAQEAGIAALADSAHEAMARDHNERWRPWLASEIAKTGLIVHPSVANFLLVEFSRHPGKNADAADLFLKSRGILVRKMGAYGLPECLRITIGKEDEVKAVAAALREFVARA